MLTEPRGIRVFLACCTVLLISSCNQPPAPGNAASSGSDNASSSAPSAALTCYDRMPSQPQVTISNLRFEGGGSNESLLVDWKTESRGPGFLVLVIVDGNGQVHQIDSPDAFSTEGTMGAEFTSFGIGSSGPSLASSCQVFVGTRDYDGLFKLSNILTSGNPTHAIQVDPPKSEWIEAAAQQLANHQE